MPDAIISRGGTSVTVPILEEGNTLVLARDVGKPTMNYQSIGREDPLPFDHLNAGDTFTFAGKLSGSNAYADAQTLAEDLIKPRATTGTPLQLDVSALPNKSTYDVAPVSSSALTLTYETGVGQLVDVLATLSVVEETIGGAQTAQASLSPAAGTGITLTDGSNPVTIPEPTVTRTVGRPTGKLNPRPADLPTYIDQNKPAEDVFEITGTLKGSTPEADATTLEETLVRTRQGGAALTLDFLSNTYGLDRYNVSPEGSQAVRTVFLSGHKNEVDVATLNLRTVHPL